MLNRRNSEAEEAARRAEERRRARIKAEIRALTARMNEYKSLKRKLQEIITRLKNTNESLKSITDLYKTNFLIDNLYPESNRTEKNINNINSIIESISSTFSEIDSKISNYSSRISALERSL